MNNNYVNEYLMSLKNTKEFRDIMDSKNALMQNPNMKNKFLEFDNQFSQIVQSQMNENQKKRQIEMLKNRYQQVMKNPLVSNYINSSEIFNKMFFENSQKILENLNQDIRF